MFGSDSNVEEFEIRVDDAQAKRATGEVEKRLGKMFDAAAFKAAAFNQALALGTKAMGAFIDYMRQGVKDAIEWERTNNQLRAALASTGQEVEHNVRSLNAYAAAIEAKFGISDEEIRKLQALTLNYGVHADKVNDTIKATMALANVTGMDLTSAFNAMQQAQQGVVPRTIKNITAFQGLTAEELRNLDVVGKLNELYGSQLDESANTSAAAVNRLTAGFDSFAEAIAKTTMQAPAMLTFMDSLAGTLQDFATIIEREGLATAGQAFFSTLFGGWGDVNRMLESYKEIDELQAKIAARRDEMPNIEGGGFDFGGKGGLAGMEFGGGKKGKGSSGPMFTMEDGFGGAFAAGGDMIFVEGVGYISQEEYTAHQNLRYDLEASYQDKLNAFRQGQVDYWLQLEEQKTGHLKQQADARAQIEEATYGRASQAALQYTQTALGAINAFAQGGILGALKYGAAMIASYGQQAIASGTAHEALAASLALIPGMQGFAAGLSASAANEIAVGSAMAIGGGIAGAAIDLGQTAATGGFDNWSPLTGKGGGGGQRGGGGGGRAGSFAAGIGGGGANYGSGGSSTYVINLNGPVLNDHHFGMQVQQAITEAKRRGLG